MNISARCPACGRTAGRRVEVREKGRLVRVYFECIVCGHVW